MFTERSKAGKNGGRGGEMKEEQKNKVEDQICACLYVYFNMYGTINGNLHMQLLRGKS